MNVKMGQHMDLSPIHFSSYKRLISFEIMHNLTTIIIQGIIQNTILLF